MPGIDKDKLAQLIARKLSLEATPEELAELERYLGQHPDDAYFVSLLHEFWTVPAPEEDPQEEDHISALLRAAATPEPVLATDTNQLNNAPKKILYFVSAAAVAATVVFLWIMLRNPRPDPLRAGTRRELVAKSGSKSRVLLPDGSTVWLNSESRLSYLPAFSDSLREVELEGEAYFDVVKNAARPFVVHTAGINIRVLGTAFNVRSYPGDLTIEATLIRGLIEVTKSHSAASPALILHPHEKVVVKKEEQDDAAGDRSGGEKAAGMTVKQLKKDASDTAIVETAWVYNKLVFDGDTFREIADRLERWFNVKIRFQDAAVARYRFHVGFENETLEEVLTSLQLSAHFTFKINRDEVDIYQQ